jgi:glycolate oxidase FAD binding subunit
MRTEVPESPDQAAEALGAMTSQGLRVRPLGGGTKRSWGAPAPDPDAGLSTAGLNRIIEHNAADLTAVLQPGLALAAARDAFADSGQMLALDPPLGESEGATVGGVVAAGDSGPLRHRYGAARDLLLGAQVALADGTLSRSGGKVIKNVAGYDLAKLFAGSFGTLGLVTEVVVRLHPLPLRRVTAVWRADDAGALERVALKVAASPLEIESLDLFWSGGAGAVLARLAGAGAERAAHEAAGVVSGLGVDAEVETEDADLWAEQRRRQRSEGGVVVRVSALATDLARVARGADRLGASLVGRAALGPLWVKLPPAEAGDLAGAVEELRRDLAPHRCVVLDAPLEVRRKVDVWDERAGAEVELMRRVKARFDPGGLCNPGVFVGGI